MINAACSAVFNRRAPSAPQFGYEAHNGQRVAVLREVPGDFNEPLFHIRADDGWTGHAYESELSDAKEL